MPSRARRRKKKESAPGWLWMLCGLALGLFVALAVYLRTPRAPMTATTELRQTPNAAERDAVAQEQLPAAEEDEPRFDFYDLLPQFEVIIPEVETSVRSDRPADRIDDPGSYVLQAGTFLELADADRRQAEIALLGIESRIQRVSIDDDIYHRVRIGPLNELADLNEVRLRLRDQRIETMLIRVP
jgi:cell division protein FtsN